MRVPAALLLLLIVPPPPGAAAQDLAAEAAALSLRKAHADATAACAGARVRPEGRPLAVRQADVRHASVHRFRVEGCGADGHRNYLVAFAADGAPRLLETLPGTTVTDPLLQIDVLRVVALAARRMVAGCGSVRVVSTRLEGATGPPAVPGREPPWLETWTVRACGQDVTVPVRFTPNSGGTAFELSAPRLDRT